jgi:hypothetical protein
MMEKMQLVWLCWDFLVQLKHFTLFSKTYFLWKGKKVHLILSELLLSPKVWIIHFSHCVCPTSIMSTDSIFVRVYETRMDLLRAVIIGAEGTPYHDGLFFFDVFFPAGYPKVPPVVIKVLCGLLLHLLLFNHLIIFNLSVLACLLPFWWSSTQPKLV